MSEATRSTTNTFYHHGKTFCDNEKKKNASPHWKGSGWYKFASPAGTKIATSAPPHHTCGTSATGWMAQLHPTEVGQTKTVQFCFNWAGNSCFWKTTGEVTKCGDKNFVYKLPEPPNCTLGYCADP